ncbi:MAG: AAA domain-containing protein, partial [Thaumarchaeota archaeon]|nr:AAA domain-containing protein [Nitrososphaerota archaeon]
DIIAALAGDNVAKAKIQSSRVNIDARSLDKRAPQDEFLIVDADSSQQCVIEAVANGQHGVIQGPPGTGKSQTIANLITALVAKGKRVLFVAEKRAALEVVLERLRKANLGHLALDLHGADVSRKGLMQQLANNWQTVQTSSEIHMSDIQRRYGVLREKLNRHAELMNVRRAPSGMSLFDIQGKLLQLPAQAISPVRWLGDELQALDQVTVQKIDDKLVELCSKASLFHKTDPSPWNGATLPDSAAVTYALQLVTKLDSESIPSLYATAQQLTDQTRLRPPTTLDEVGEITKLISEVATFLDLYSEEIFTLDLNAYLTILEPHQRLLSAVISLITNREYRQGVSILNSFRKKRAPSPVSLYKEVKAARDLVEKWQRLSDTASIPSDASSIAKILVKAVTIVFEDLDHLSTCFQGKDFRSEKFNEIREFMDSLKNDQNTPFVIPNITSIESRLVELGMRKFVDYLREKQPVPSEWKNLFHYAWLMSCYNSVRLQENEVAAFDGTTHDRFVEEFKRLDNERQNLNATNIRYVHAKNVIDVMNAYSAEASIVRNEMQKKARHLPLRKLIARAPHVLTTLCPCWMASPLSISQLIGAESQHFDVVLFDEASQVLPQDAVSAILRARQVVVAGDRHQLPPTSFFTLVEDDEDEREEACQTEGFESILDQMGGFLDPWYLQWHYRSRDETLIAFSNRHIYNDLLTTFPNSEASLSLQHVLVDASRDSDLNEDSPGEEVNKVVSLILEHAKERPNESLGVITLGVKHQRRIEEALDQALQSENGTIGFFDESRREKFFIKNLERVQGDERDAIILSIGYGKDASGKLPYRFGPILYEGGERRLNVAVTRARNRMTVVSSFSHFDMDPSRSSARGVELLRLYLQYAASVVRRKYTDS